jgi:GNAT superfamily N-acetyltransferase
VIVREAGPDDYAVIGSLTVAAYHALPGYVVGPTYDAELRAVDERVTHTDTAVVVAVDDDGTVLGGVTYVRSPASPYAEFDDPTGAGFRALAVAPAAQGKGAGRALVEAVLARAQADGRRRVIIHTTPWMTTAHGLYDRLGFVRRPDLDWTPVPDVPLWGFVRELP